MKKNIIFSGLIALIVSLSSILISNKYFENNNTVRIEHVNKVPSNATHYDLGSKQNYIPQNFNETAEKVIDAVVHIKSTQIIKNRYNNFQSPDPFKDLFGNRFEDFFGQPYRYGYPKKDDRSTQKQTRVGTGSGVIISMDGYIVTNNHVIAEADDIEITLHDNRTYKATVIGTDPSTDLALLRIKDKNLPSIPIQNSDVVEIGQWVLAVGNPMGLNSTVTAGIVSATGRNINILKDKYAVENFIQTDAAINPGNSGGALVNLEGGLVGINTAIASPTGTFAGYGFAIPSNIVSKVIEDLINYGTVQRGMLGIMIRNLDGNLAKEKKLELTQGVYVDSLFENSAAAKAGVEVGDVISKVNDRNVNSSSELQGTIAQYRPGEKISLTVNRKGKDKIIEVVLNNKEGSTEIIDESAHEIIKVLGAEFEELTKEEASDLNLDFGVKVKKLYAGKLKKDTDLEEGFIITHINGRKVKSEKDLVELLESKKGGVMLEGVYEDLPGEFYYAFGL